MARISHFNWCNKLKFDSINLIQDAGCAVHTIIPEIEMSFNKITGERFMSPRQLPKTNLPQKILLLSFLCAAIPTFVPSAMAADWPTYNADSRRSGISAEKLTLPLKLRWVRRSLHAPHPAWPPPAGQDRFHGHADLSPTTIFDRVFHTAAVGNLLYYGSSADDTIYCIEASTGRTRWSFVTEGPVRLAPTIADGKVYVASDDGFLYCLDAKSGRLLWQYRPGPEDRRLPGNERMISLWPIRCGIVAEKGVVYFAAGLFPRQGVYLCAVNGRSGKQIWKQKIEISAQGYLLASPTRLFLLTGRTAPHIYDRATGRHIAGLQNERGQGGGAVAILADDEFVYGPGELGLMQRYDIPNQEKIATFDGLRMVVDTNMAYLHTKHTLSALYRGDYLIIKKRKESLEKRRQELQGRLSKLARRSEQTKQLQKQLRRLRVSLAKISKKLDTRLEWTVPCEYPYALIMAGNVLFAGGHDEIAAFSTLDGKKLWTEAVAGKAYGLAASNGTLFAATDNGSIYCFTPQVAGDAPVVRPSARENPFGTDALSTVYTKVARELVRKTGIDKGYCLVLDCGEGRLAYELARLTNLRIIAVQPDAAKVATAREMLRKTGLYGKRIVIHHVAPEKLPYQKYFANLIVSDDLLRTGNLPRTPAREVLRLLRPSGGVVALAGRNGIDSDALSKWGKATLPHWQVKTEKQLVWAIARREKLKGAGEWTHMYADPGNTACSQDKLVQAPMELQWFGRPGPRKMVDRHNRTAAPLYKDGRLFVSGTNYIVAVDAYNGTILWEYDLPDSVRLAVLKNSGNMAVTDKLLYVAAGNRCLGFDVRTGENKAGFSVPASTDDTGLRWGYLASVADILFGSATRPDTARQIQTANSWKMGYVDFTPLVCSDTLFGFDRNSGKKLWLYEPQAGVIINPTIALGGDRIYCVESANPQTRSVITGRIKLDMLLGKGANLLALNIRTGETIWKRPVDLKSLQHNIYLSYSAEKLLVTGSKNVFVDQNKQVMRYEFWAFDAATGKTLWQMEPAVDAPTGGGHGEQDQHPAIVGRVFYTSPFAYDLQNADKLDAWQWKRGGGGCGTISTSAFSLFNRGNQPQMTDLRTGKQIRLTNVTRPGCWINIIPAGGLVLIPEASSGCTCAYSIQTSLAFVPAQTGP